MGPVSMVNQETVRDAFVALLGAAKTASALSCQAVYGYRIGDFGSQSPIVTVSSAGDQLVGFTAAGFRTHVWLQVDTFTLYSDKGSWTEALAEDRKDLLKQQINQVVVDNQVTAAWQSIDMGGRSQRVDVTIGGNEYIRETWELLFEVYG